MEQLPWGVVIVDAQRRIQYLNARAAAYVRESSWCTGGNRFGLPLPAAQALALVGCTTMDMLSDAGDSFEEGNIGSGIFMGVGGLLFGPLLDIFTLGGTLEGEDITKTWESGLDSYAAIKGANASTASSAVVPSSTQVVTASASGASSSSFAQNVASADQASGNSQSSSGFGASAIARPAQPAVPAAVSQSTAPVPNVVVSLVRERYIQTVPNQYEVVLKNMGNVRVSCRVTFRYQYPDGRGGLAWDSVVKSIGPIAVGGTGVAVAGTASKNIGNVGWTQTCEQWVLDK